MMKKIEKKLNKLTRQEFLACCKQGALSIFVGSALCKLGLAQASAPAPDRSTTADANPKAAASATKASSPPLARPYTLTLAGTLEPKMERVIGVAFDKNDRLYVAGSLGVNIYDPAGQLLRNIKTTGPACCVAIDSEGNIYVGERTKMSKFDDQGKLLVSWGTPGKKDGDFQYLTAVAVSNRNIYIADAGGRCIHHFSTDGDFIEDFTGLEMPAGNPSSSELDFKDAKWPDMTEKFIIPSGYFDCATDSKGILYVGHTGKHRIERYDGSDKMLGCWGKFGTEPENFCGCCNPTNLALFADGRIATAEKGIPRLKVYDEKGKLLAFLGSEAFPANVAGMALAVNSKNRIAMVEPIGGIVRFYELRIRN